jgi:dTDP-4-dehydrorhamnose 3,5-epimerase
MKITDTPIDGLKVFELKKILDPRGYFIERFKSDHPEFKNYFKDYIQDNHSWSHPGVIRGIHYQRNPDQGKLVSVIRGRILDVAVDLRKNSKTFGQHFSIELSDENALMLWLPAGFGHGFSVLGDQPADVIYKVNQRYNPSGEGGIVYNDSELKIDWKVATPTLNDKDLKLPTLSDYKNNPSF